MIRGHLEVNTTGHTHIPNAFGIHENYRRFVHDTYRRVGGIHDYYLCLK